MTDPKLKVSAGGEVDTHCAWCSQIRPAHTRSCTRPRDIYSEDRERPTGAKNVEGPPYPLYVNAICSVCHQYKQHRPGFGQCLDCDRKINPVLAESLEAVEKEFPEVCETLDHDHAERLTDILVNHPAHYKSHPSGIECIQITEHMNFNLGNAMKYIWRSDHKASPMQDLKKARWYLDRELARISAGPTKKETTP